MRAIGVHLREALAGFRRDWRTAGLSLLVVAASVLATGIVLVASRAADRAVARLAQEADLSVFLARRRAGRRARAGGGRVAARPRGGAASTFVDPSAAGERFRRAFPGPRAAARRRGAAAGVLRRAAAVRAGSPAPRPTRSRTRSAPCQAWIPSASSAISRNAAPLWPGPSAAAGWLLAAVLALAGALTVFSIVRLSYVARRDEVEILYLVGVPVSTIRGPFVLEGLLQGLGGAVFGLVALRRRSGARPRRGSPRRRWARLAQACTSGSTGPRRSRSCSGAAAIGRWPRGSRCATRRARSSPEAKCDRFWSPVFARFAALTLFLARALDWVSLLHMYQPKTLPRSGFTGRLSRPLSLLIPASISIARSSSSCSSACSRRGSSSPIARSTTPSARCMRIVAQLDELCGQQDADAVVSGLLQKFGIVARLAAWSDSRPVH